MSRSCVARIVAALGLVLLLAGCVDATVDIELTGPSTARATLTQQMGAQFYAMIAPDVAAASRGDAAARAVASKFCAKGELVENPDGSAACTFTEQGPFDSITLGRDQKRVQFTTEGPNLVRITLPAAALLAELGAHSWDDEETRQMNQSLFSGRTLTLRFGGIEVVDTNMSLSADRTSAQQVIQFLDLLNRTANLPATLYAVVRVK